MAAAFRLVGFAATLFISAAGVNVEVNSVAGVNIETTSAGSAQLIRSTQVHPSQIPSNGPDPVMAAAKYFKNRFWTINALANLLSLGHSTNISVNVSDDPSTSSTSRGRCRDYTCPDDMWYTKRDNVEDDWCATDTCDWMDTGRCCRKQSLFERDVATIVCFIIFTPCLTFFLAALYLQKKTVPAVQADMEADLTDWSSRKFACDEDCNIFCCAFWCPCFRWADTLDMVGLLSYWPAVGIMAFILTVEPMLPALTDPLASIVALFCLLGYRLRLKRAFNFKEQREDFPTVCEECLFTFWCYPCSIAQEARHVKKAALVGSQVLVKTTVNDAAPAAQGDASGSNEDAPKEEEKADEATAAEPEAKQGDEAAAPKDEKAEA